MTDHMRSAHWYWSLWPHY